MTRTPRPTRREIIAHTGYIATRELVSPAELRGAAKVIRATGDIPGLRWPARALRDAIAEHLDDVADHMDDCLINIGRAIREQVEDSIRTPSRSDHHIPPEQGRANLLADLDALAAIANLKHADGDTPRDYRGDPVICPARYIYVPEGTDVGTDVIATGVNPAGAVHIVNPTGTPHIDTHVRAGDLHPRHVWLWEGEPVPSDFPRGTLISRRPLPARPTPPAVVLDHDAAIPADAPIGSFVMRKPDPRELYVDEGEEPHLFDADGDRLLKGTRYVVLPGPRYSDDEACAVAVEGDILDGIHRSIQYPLDVSGKVEDGPLAPKWPNLSPAYLRPEEAEDLDPDDYPDRETDPDA